MGGCRLGGTAGFLYSGYLLEFMDDSVEWALWFSVVLNGLAWLSTMVFAYLRAGSYMARTIIPLMEAPAQSSLGSPDTSSSEKSLSSEMKGFTDMTWLLVLQIGLLYACIFPFETVETEFLVEDWGIRFRHVGLITSLGTAFGLISWSWGLCITNRKALLRWSVIAWCSLVGSFLILLTRRGDSRATAMFAICVFGAAYSYLSTTCWSLIPETFYKGGDYSTGAVSMTYVAMSFGMFLSTSTGGLLHDMTGGYTSSLVYFTLLGVVGVFLALQLEQGLLAAHGPGTSGIEPTSSSGAMDQVQIDASDRPVPLASRASAAGWPVAADAPQTAKRTGDSGSTLEEAVCVQNYFGGEEPQRAH